MHKFEDFNTQYSWERPKYYQIIQPNRDQYVLGQNAMGKNVVTKTPNPERPTLGPLQLERLSSLKF